MRHGQVGAGYMLRRAMKNAKQEEKHNRALKSNPITPEQLAASNTEHGHQAALFCWAQLNLDKYPQLKWMYAIPNGFFATPGQKAKMKAEGLKDGVPDICLPVAIGYNGLYIELKVGNNQPSKDQIEYITFLIRQGYAACVCYGWEQARDVIIKYLEGK